MQANAGRILIGRLAFKSDLLTSLTEFCRSENIRLGTLTVIGALIDARLGFYNQNTKKYIESIRLDEHLEIVSCLGNVSLKDGEVFVHAHMLLANDKGAVYGGHLVPGNTIFAAEYTFRELTGGELHRELDAETGLFLWPPDAARDKEPTS